LPYELCDRIIDFLHDDKMSLRACALTCRCWILACRFHLFPRLLDIRHGASGSRDVHMMKSAPHLGTFVTTICLSGLDARDLVGLELPSVEHVQIQDSSCISDRDVDAYAFLLNQFLALRTVHLSHMVFTAFALRKLIFTTARLKSLRVTKAHLRRGFNESSHVKAVPQHCLEALHLDGPSTKLLLPLFVVWMSGSSAMLTTLSIHLRRLSETLLRSVKQLIRNCSVLQFLTVGMFVMDGSGKHYCT
jgi:hypothetical protein